MTQVEPKRDSWGRYLFAAEEGGDPVPYTRATTIAGTLDDRYNLERWGRRTMVAGFLAKPGLLAAATAVGGDDKAGLDRVCEEALEAGGAHDKAELGTALHGILERINAGEEVDVPAPWDLDVLAWHKTRDEAKLRVLPEYSERVIVHDQLSERVAGTCDLVVEVNGTRQVADYKTGDDPLRYGALSIAMQMALYANGDAMVNLATGEREPMPQVDRRRALVIHIPAGRGECTLHSVDIEAGWRAVHLALEVRAWRRRHDLAAELVPRDLDPVARRRAWLTERIHYLRDTHPAAFRMLARTWPEDVPTLKASDEHGADALAAIAAALSAAEAVHGVKFPETVDPGARVPRRKTETVTRRTKSAKSATRK